MSAKAPVRTGHAIHAPCGQRIVWANTAAMEKIPLDWPPSNAGTMLADVTAAGGFSDARPYVAGQLILFPAKRFADHRLTCPEREPGDGDQTWWTSDEPELDPSFADQVRAEQARRGRQQRNKRGRRPGKPITGIRWRGSR